MKYDRGVYSYKGYVRVRIWLGPKRNPDGTENAPYQRSMGCVCNPHIQKANNHVKEVRGNFEKGLKPAPDPEALAVPTACDIYHKRHWVEKRGRSAESVRNIAYKLNFFRTYWKARAWHTILVDEIEAYMGWRKGVLDETGNKLLTPRPGVSDGTVDNELNILSSMFNEIEKWINRRAIAPYLLPTNTLGNTFNPVEYIERDSLIETKRERTASRQELVKLKEYCDANDPDMLIMIERAICTGLRKTDLEKVNGLKDVRGVLSKSKEKKLFRMPIDFSLRINYKNFDRRWDAVRTACDMKDFHWHDWRHTAGTMLSLLGFSDEDIQKFYDHSSLRQTQDYINTGKERLRPQVEGLRGHLAEIWKEAKPAALQDPAMKVCRGCGELKPLKAYGKHSAFKSGLDSRCKACNYKRLVAQRRLNPEIRVHEYAKNRIRAVSSAVEHLPHTEGATGSSPVLPTISIRGRSVSNSVSKHESVA